MKTVLAIGITLMTLVCWVSGCTEEASTIEVKIQSFYPFDTEGYFTIDGIFIDNVFLSLLNTTNFTVDKSLLPHQQFHNVTVYLESAASEEELEPVNASCDKVTERVKFVLSVQYALSCTSYS